MNISLKISKKAIWYFIAFFFLIKPPYFNYIPGLASIYNWGMLGVAAIVLLKTIQLREVTELSFFIIGIQLFPLVVSIFSGIEITMALLIQVIQVIAMTLLLQNGLKKSFDKCIGAMALILEIYTYINFFTILAFPGGLYATEVYTVNWFLGYKNVMIRFILPAMCVNTIYSVYKNNRYSFRNILLIAVAFASELIADCKTGLVGVIFVIFMMMLFTRKDMPKFINLKNGVILIIIFSILLTSPNVTRLFDTVLAALGEEASFSTRELIWGRTIELISEAPFFGYGLRTTDGYRQLLNVSLGWTYVSHPHNYFLYVMLQGGLVELILVILMFFRVSRKCILKKENVGARMIILMYISFFIMGLMESLVGTSLLYPIAVFSDYILNKPMEYISRKKSLNQQSNQKGLLK